MKQYIMNVYTERLYDLVENSDFIPSKDIMFIEGLQAFIQEVWQDGFYSGISASECENQK